MATAAVSAALAILAGAIPIMTGQSAGQQATDTDVVAVNVDRTDRMTVPVRVAEQGPFHFLIDTGAQNTVLSRGLATQLGLRPSARATIVGVAGTQAVDTVHLEQIDLGRRSFYGLLAPLLDAANIGADGILGLDSLQGQRVLLDFRKNLIAIDDARDLGGDRGYEIVVRARRKSGQLILTDAKLDGVSVRVVIDTGAETSIGNLALQRALNRRHQKDGTATLTSVTGQQVQANLGLGRGLSIDKITFANVLIAYADSPAFAALGLDKRPALLLGMRDLRGCDRVAIDFSSRKILFDVPAGTL